MATFIVDCPTCKAKVAAEETGRAEDTGFDNEVGEPYGWRLFVGKCPRCTNLTAAESRQLRFKGGTGTTKMFGQTPCVYILSHRRRSPVSTYRVW